MGGGGGGCSYCVSCVQFSPKLQFSFISFVFVFIRLVRFLFFFFVLAFFTIAIVKQPHYKRISLHLHPVLHPITLCYIRSAVVLLGLPPYAFSLFTILGLSTIAISDSILAKDVTWIVQRHAFALYIDLDTFTLLPGWIISMNLGVRRQKSQVSRPCFGPCQLFFVKCMRATSFIFSGLKHGKLDIRWE